MNPSVTGSRFSKCEPGCCAGGEARQPSSGDAFSGAKASKGSSGFFNMAARGTITFDA